jgi:hypothetical protein
MVFDTSEFEGPRFDCNNYAIATGDKNTNVAVGAINITCFNPVVFVAVIY